MERGYQNFSFLKESPIISSSSMPYRKVTTSWAKMFLSFSMSSRSLSLTHYSYDYRIMVLNSELIFSYLNVDNTSNRSYIPITWHIFPVTKIQEHFTIRGTFLEDLYCSCHYQFNSFGWCVIKELYSQIMLEIICFCTYGNQRIYASAGRIPTIYIWWWKPCNVCPFLHAWIFVGFNHNLWSTMHLMTNLLYIQFFTILIKIALDWPNIFLNVDMFT